MRENRHRYLEHTEKWPERAVAYGVTHYAVKTGRLVRQPCEICGLEPTEAHHDDYEAPFDVRWLCRPCHTAEHQRPRGNPE